MTFSDQYAQNEQHIGIIASSKGKFWWILLESTESKEYIGEQFDSKKYAKQALFNQCGSVKIIKQKEFYAIVDSRQAEMRAAENVRKVTLRDNFWANVEETITIADRINRPLEADFGSYSQYKSALELYHKEIAEQFAALGNDFICTIADVVMYRWLFEAYEINYKDQMYVLPARFNILAIDKIELLLIDDNRLPVWLIEFNLNTQVAVTKHKDDIKIEYSNGWHGGWFVSLEIPIDDFRVRDVRVELLKNDKTYSTQINQSSSSNSLKVIRQIMKAMSIALEIAEAWENQNMFADLKLTVGEAKEIVSLLSQGRYFHAIHIARTGYDVIDAKDIINSFQDGTYTIS